MIENPCEYIIIKIRKGRSWMNMKDYLQNDILDFWLKNGMDYENGGIYTCVDEKGNLYGSDKSVWFQGRALWVFSKAYNIIEKKEEYLNAARNLYHFLPNCTDTDHRMYFTVTKDGKELQKRRYYYSETFASIGCAELYKATGEAEIFEKAEYYFDIAYSIFKNPSLTAPKVNPENAPFKVLAPVMIMLNTAQVMHSTGVNQNKYIKIVKECADEIVGGGYINTEIGAVLESVKTDGSFYDSPSARITNPGHSLECAWFLMGAGMLLNDHGLLKTGKNIVDMALRVGYDKKHGGIIAFNDVLGRPPVQLEWDMKLWWPQCEAMIACLLSYHLFKEEKYRKIYEKIKKYAFKHFADTKNGEWYGYLHYDNTPSTTLKGNIFKGPFHIPRLIMFLHIMERDGNANAFFN